MKDAKQTALHDLIRNAHFQIPDYQRNYEWGAEQVTDLLEDLTYVYEHDTESAMEHFFGTLVLGNNGEYTWSRSKTVPEYEVIDGQQRLITVTLLMSELASELDKVSAVLPSSKPIAQEAADNADTLQRTYIGEDKPRGFKYRLSPSRSTREAYKLSVRPDSPDRTPSDNHIAIRRVVNAKETIHSKVIQWRQSQLNTGSITEADTPSLERYTDYLLDIAQIANNNLIVTQNIVEDMDEAARMFKVINERGKDLSIFDRVKSHIVYCASQCEELSTEKVSQSLEDTVEVITSTPETDESTVDNFVRVHWTIWTGDYPARSRSRGESVDDIIQNDSRYADPNRDDIETWVREYVSTFEMLARHYVELRYPSQFRQAHAEEDYVTDISNRLLTISLCRSPDEYIPPLIATKEAFGCDSIEFKKILTYLESVAFRYHHLMRISGSLSSHTATGAYEIFWASVGQQTANNMFNGEPLTDLTTGNRRVALNKLTDKIKTKINTRCDDETIRDYLNEDDIISGKSRTNWGGIHSKDVIRLIFREHEKRLRRQSDDQPRKIQPPQEWTDNTKIEYISSEPDGVTESDLSEEDYNPLGNLTVVSTSSPGKASGDTVCQYSAPRKIEQTKASGNGWGQQEMEQYRQSIIETVLSRWPASIGNKDLHSW